ncbi:MAG: hypothetical protein ACRD2T_10015, partial [Thermoanaerobaculia bacterium]
MARRGKTIALSCAALAVAALAGGAVLLRERLLEEWYLRKLCSADEEEVFRAAEMLGKLGSTRAVPELLGLVNRPAGQADSTAASTDVVFVDLSDLQNTGPQNLPFALVGGRFGSNRMETPLARLLRETGCQQPVTTGSLYLRGNVAMAVPEEVQAQFLRTLRTIRKVCSILDAMGEPALPAVETAAADPGLHAATRAFADYYLARRRGADPVLRLAEGG